MTKSRVGTDGTRGPTAERLFLPGSQEPRLRVVTMSPAQQLDTLTEAREPQVSLQRRPG